MSDIVDKMLLSVGKEVIDGLTGQRTRIIGVTPPKAPSFHHLYTVDSTYLDGERYGWEIMLVSKE